MFSNGIQYLETCMSNKLLAELIGKNNAYYTHVFDNLLTKDNARLRIFRFGLLAPASINWAAFLVSLLGPFPFFFYYRKMYKLAFLLNIASLFVVSLSLTEQITIGVYIYDGAFILYSLLFSNAAYLSHINKKLRTLSVVSNENRPQAVKRVGGVTYCVPIVAFLISGPSSIVLLVLIEYCKRHI